MKSIKKRQSTKTVITILLCIFTLFSFCTIAYSAFSSTMNITGIGYSRVEADIRVTDFTIKEANNGTSSYQEFSKNTVTSSINLPSNSEISYNLEITNYSNEYFAINNITGLPEGLTYEIKNYNLNDAICDESGKCNNNITKNFELIIKTSDNAYEGDFCLEFVFKILHTINYINFTGDYTKYVIKGSSININLSNDSPRYVNLISENKTNYEFENNEITIYNITSDIELVAINEEIKNTYSYTGSYQTFTAPYNGMYKVELWGAQGGTSIAQGATGKVGGKGGYTAGSIYLNAGEKLYVYIGGKGTNATVGKNSTGGYNGGGNGTWDNKDDEAAGAGGGATDIRYFTSTPTSSELTWNSSLGLKSRIMVAAGGGGACYNTLGGSGGGLVGNTIAKSSIPGTQISGYKFGIGESTTTPGTDSNGRSGGGGGYYGGRTTEWDASNAEAAAGGSSYISGHDGCNAITTDQIHTGSSLHFTKKYFIDTKMIDGNGYSWTTKKESQTSMPTQDGTSTMTGNSGNGYAKITLLSIMNKKFEALEEEVYNINRNNYYEYTKTYQKFTAPYNGIYKVELWGAGGGSSMVSGATSTAGGKGGYVNGKIYLEKDESLYIYVGGKGADAALETNSAGGWNGGGTGTWDGGDDETAGAGGGATDVRFFSATPTSSELAWNSSKGFNSRIMVAGGGGGTAWTTMAGHGGGLTGTSSNPDAQAGTQTTGYAFGQGKSGSGAGVSNDGIGGGGSGYYGGYTESKTSGRSSGAGGSSFISGHTGCNAIDVNRNHTGTSVHFSNKKFTETTMIDGEGYSWTTTRGSSTGMPTFDGTSTMVGNATNGYAKITLIEATRIYNISYFGIEGNYQNTIEKGQNLVIEFNEPAPKKLGIKINDIEIVNYTYENNILTIHNVTGNVQITALSTTYTYSYTGNYQEFIPQFKGIYRVELWGASGGHSITNGEQGAGDVGLGAYTSGEIELSPNKSLYIYIGGKGNDAKLETNVSGGYNGGGIGSWDNRDNEASGGGGGATDIRLQSGAWNDFDSLKSRIMVAAGGGGASARIPGTIHKGGGLENDINGQHFQYLFANGNYYDVIATTKTTTQTTGYAFGYGENGKNTCFFDNQEYGSDGVPGAGSGYMGGYVGDQTTQVDLSGGGSSFISGHNGCNAINSSSTSSNLIFTNQSVHYSGYKFTNTKMVDGGGYTWTNVKGSQTGMPTYDGTSTMTGNTGNGYAKITLIELT